MAHNPNPHGKQNRSSDSLSASSSAHGKSPAYLKRQLTRSRVWAKLAIIWERLWPRLLPVLSVLALFLVISWFDLWVLVPDWARFVGLALFGLVAFVGLYPLLSLRLPNREEVDHRIQTETQVEHRPITAQSDRISSNEDDPIAQALWAEHQKRMSEKLDHLKSGLPNPSVARFDPYALRAVLPLLLFVAFLYSWGDHVSPLVNAVKGTSKQEQLAGRIDAWITPPAYTSRPPIFLSRRVDKPEPNASTATTEDVVEVDASKAFTVPENSQLIVRMSGVEPDIRLEFKNEAGKTFIALDAQAQENEKDAAKVDLSADNTALKSDTKTTQDRREFQFPVKENGAATLYAGETVINTWQFSVIPDKDPEIAFEKEPSRAVNGALELSYSVKDDYGVASVEAEMKPLEKQRENARPLITAPDLRLSLPRRRAKDGKAKVNRDLTSHPWAGAGVRLTLVVRDEAEQTGRSETKTFKLPARRFTKNLAKAIVQQRRNLALDANAAPFVAGRLDVITETRPDMIDDLAVYTGLRVARAGIGNPQSDDHLREMLDLLWDIALAVEDGDLSLAERRLRDAQEALSEALENGASDEEISKLTEELRQAMAEYLQELQRQMARNPQSNQPMNNEMMRELRTQDLNKMLDQIEKLAKSGSKDAARELLSQLQQMMDNLQAGRHQQQRQAEGDQMNQQMNKLGELMQRQQELMNETFRMQQEQQRRGQNGQQNRQPGQRGQQQQGQRQQGQNGQQQQGQQPGQNGEGMTQEEFEQAMRQLQQQQGQIQKELEQLGQALKEFGLDPSKEFGEAGEAMGQAGENLGQGDAGSAVGSEGQALEALRRGAQSMMQQMQQNMAGDRGGTDPQGRRSNNRGQDPLGRQQRSQGPDFGDEVRLPEEIDTQRAREILDAIRKKLGNQLRPKLELDYLERLLKGQ